MSDKLRVPKTSYVEKYLRVWLVGVRSKRRRIMWNTAWHPTSLKWFITRARCREYIENEISEGKKEVYEYKPLLYAPVKKLRVPDKGGQG